MTSGDPELLQVEELAKDFRIRRSTLQPARMIRAVDNVSFTVRQGQTTAIVGESGSGKSTTGRLIVRLLEATSGRILFQGRDVAKLSQRELREMRRNLQMIFQDPLSSLNRRMTVLQTVGEPLKLDKVCPRREIPTRVTRLLNLVGLGARHLDRFPHELSGGQRQRVCIARALAREPDLLVLDEPVSALDVSVQAQILNLLRDLQQQFGMSYLFISHDLSVVGHIADYVLVMYAGQIIEEGPKRDILTRPHHPYTQALLAAAPRPEPDQDGERIVLGGEPIDPEALPSGCRFHTRCWRAEERCTVEPPALTDRGLGHPSACHFPSLDPRSESVAAETTPADREG